MTVRMRIFRNYSILLVAAMALTILMAQGLVRSVFQDLALRNYQRELVYITNQFQTRIDHVEKYLKTIALDPVVIDTFENYPQTPKSESDIYIMNQILRKRSITIIGSNQDIYQHLFATLDGTFLFFGHGDAIQKSIGDFLGKDFFVENNVGRGVVLSGPYEIQRVDGTIFQFFILAKQVVDLMTMDPIGYVAFVLEEEFFSEIIAGNMHSEIQADFYLISEDMRILSSSQKENVGDKMTETKVLSDKAMENLRQRGICEVKDTKGTRLYTMTKIPDRDWSVIHVTSMETLLRSQMMVLWVVFIIALVFCIISLCIAKMIAKQITDPIVELSRRMANYHCREGNRDVSPYVSADEIENLYLAFDRMVEKSDLLMKQIYIEQEEKSNYQLQLIQAQIKPHFLYNTLEMIKSLVDCQMYEEAGSAIMSISRFYRLSLNSGNDITSVAQEMELAQQYLYIQRLRYAEYMDYSVIECDGMGNYAIPKLTLQPLLENAIYHGIKEKEEKGRIELSIQEKENSLIFTVLDNGVGIAPMTLKKLRASLETSKKNADSFGLYSINRRIQLFFGENYGLEIESEQAEFTRVIVTIPKINLNTFQEEFPKLMEDRIK